MAHIGVIRWLLEHRFEIRSISGASIGALVGGVYASGGLDDFEKWVRGISKPMMVTLMDLSWGRGGLVKGERFLETLSRYARPGRIEDLPISFTAVAAELASGKEIWLRSGDLLQAIRASISLPLLFTPYDHAGEMLIDGGVLNPVPIAPTFGDDTDLTIAVSLNGPPELESTPDPGASGGTALQLSPEIVQWFDRIQTMIWPDADPNAQSAGRAGDSTPDARADGDGPSPPGGTASGSSSQPNQGSGTETGAASFGRVSRRDWSAYEVAYLAFDAMQGTIARQKLAAYPPDELIEIRRSACRTLEFDRASELIDIGYRQAGEVLGPLL